LFKYCHENQLLYFYAFILYKDINICKCAENIFAKINPQASKLAG